MGHAEGGPLHPASGNSKSGRFGGARPTDGVQGALSRGRWVRLRDERLCAQPRRNFAAAKLRGAGPGVGGSRLLQTPAESALLAPSPFTRQGGGENEERGDEMGVEGCLTRPNLGGERGARVVEV